MLYTDKPTVFSTNTIIFSRFSDDDGKTWSDPVRVNDDLGNISAVHFQPALAVDQTTGFIAAAWYDTRNDPGSGPGDRDKIANTDVEVFATVSFDGGVTWQPNIQVASGPSNSQSFDFNTGNQFGDYIGLAYNNGVFFPTWTDNNPLQLSNPDRGTGFDIFTARVVVNAPPTMLPEDRFEPNDSSARATALGTLLDPVTLTGLTINIHANGLPDNDWFRMNTGGPGVFTATINYKSPDLGDLHMRVFTVNSKGTLIQLGSSRNVGVKTQTVSFDVFNDIPIYVWIYGNNGAQATYDMTVSVA